jgi:hypothetical protein
MDMSSSVKWVYAPLCEPRLPLKILPHEAYSTILTVNANEDTMVRKCYCPLSITAVVGKQDHKHQIVAATDAFWTTTRTAVEPADAFRVDMRLDDGCKIVVGAPLTINLDISNLSPDTRQLMLLVDSDSASKRASGSSGRWAIVSEKGGYKFGIAGPDGERDLLPVDNALLLGDVKGHSSIKARLRVIPLLPGTINLPNFKLMENRTGKRYSCIHRMQAVVSPSLD